MFSQAGDIAVVLAASAAAILSSLIAQAHNKSLVELE
jgi:hypothetical protein